MPRAPPRHWPIRANTASCSVRAHRCLRHPYPPNRFTPVSALRTFIVEDNLLIYENLVTTLQELAGVEVIGHARDEAHAVRWLRQAQPFELMIVDIYLLSGSGLGVLKAAQEVQPGVRRVVLTNRATPDIRERCAQLGADRVFDKSCELEALISYCEQIADGSPTTPGGLH